MRLLAGGEQLYLDCYFYGAMLGDRFPVNSYGPASIKALLKLRGRIAHNFDRTEITAETKGECPLPSDLWPGVKRPR